jgi:hypothetical protein
MAHMESLWPRLAELPLVVESCELYDRVLAAFPDAYLEAGVAPISSALRIGAS